MNLKTKLNWGIGLLFSLILVLIAVAVFFVNSLKLDTENILTANYLSLEYSRNMGAVLEEYPAGKSTFEKNLLLQEGNISEFGEREQTATLRRHYESFYAGREESRPAIRNDLFKLIDLNMAAIKRKSEQAKATANNAVFWISVTGTVCFLIAFTLLVNLPVVISNPLKQLTGSIRQIADNNYAQRVHFEGSSEFVQLAQSFNSMAEKLEEYRNSNVAKLMMEKSRIEALINNMHDPVLGLDESGKVLFANGEAVNITGLPAAQLLGHSVDALAESNDLLRLLTRNSKEEAEAAGKPLKIWANGKEGFFEKEIIPITIIPPGETAARRIGQVILLRNITLHKELDLAKTNFIATVSHEFKTPIAAIKMSLQLLQNKQVGPLNAEQSYLLESVSDDANRLLKITGELLHITQVESGYLQLSILPVAVSEVIKQAVEATQAAAAEKENKVKIDLPADLPLTRADMEKTSWVLTNLLANAIRYSYEYATVSVTAQLAGGHICIAVCDTGQGIAAQYLPKLFNRYFRVPGTKKEGTGLGLAISKELVEAQGGTITVESELGSGSCFTVRMPAG